MLPPGIGLLEAERDPLQFVRPPSYCAETHLLSNQKSAGNTYASSGKGSTPLIFKVKISCTRGTYSNLIFEN
jgi:hypothetical protein